MGVQLQCFCLSLSLPLRAVYFAAIPKKNKGKQSGPEIECGWPHTHEGVFVQRNHNDKLFIDKSEY